MNPQSLLTTRVRTETPNPTITDHTSEITADQITGDDSDVKVNDKSRLRASKIEKKSTSEPVKAKIISAVSSERVKKRLPAEKKRKMVASKSVKQRQMAAKKTKESGSKIAKRTLTSPPQTPATSYKVIDSDGVSNSSQMKPRKKLKLRVVGQRTTQTPTKKNDASSNIDILIEATSKSGEVLVTPPSQSQNAELKEVVTLSSGESVDASMPSTFHEEAGSAPQSVSGRPVGAPVPLTSREELAPDPRFSSDESADAHVPCTSREEPGPAPQVIDGVEWFEVESILNMRTKKGAKDYFVRWKGYDSSYDTWEPSDGLIKSAPEIVDAFLAKSGNYRRRR